MTLHVGGGGGGSPIPNLSGAGYAQFGNAAGQTIAHGLVDYTWFTLDYENGIGADFALTLGTDHITITKTGLYQVMGSVYIDDTALSTGEIACATDPTNGFFVTIPCLAAATDRGNAFCMRLLAVTTVPTAVKIGVIQTDSSDHLLGMDAAIIRLGDVPA